MGSQSVADRQLNEMENNLQNNQNESSGIVTKLIEHITTTQKNKEKLIHFSYLFVILLLVGLLFYQQYSNSKAIENLFSQFDEIVYEETITTTTTQNVDSGVGNGNAFISNDNSEVIVNGDGESNKDSNSQEKSDSIQEHSDGNN